jgi:hypothetical protein
MAIMQALGNATEGLIPLIVLPKWFLFLTKWGRELICGHNALEVSHLSTLHEGP